jgi:hypothetical protein
MIELLFLFIVLMICYFAIRVNRIELRMNILEKALNDGIQDGKIHTEAIGKPFGGESLGVRDFFRAIKDAWKRA